MDKWDKWGQPPFLLFPRVNGVSHHFYYFLVINGDKWWLTPFT